MTTKVTIDSNLVKRILHTSKAKNKDRAIQKALEDYLLIKERSAILDLFGKVEFRKDYDYKALRSRQ
ncbi:MAG: type II toxin-antitoxin system VapB family antitoxin [Bacteroidota bacterium]